MNKILVVDDSKMILEMAKNIIEDKILNSWIMVESNPVEAKQVLLENDFHVVILDIVMPEITGIELLQWIKKQEKLKELKVIMFTSLNDNEALVKCFQYGAYDFISKPLEENEFAARVNHAILEYRQSEVIKRSLQEMELKNEELSNLNKKIRYTQAELLQSERLASVGFLAAGMAHEINNPLGFIRSNVNTLKTNMMDVHTLYEKSKSLLTDQLVELAEYEKDYAYDFIREDSKELFEDIAQGIKRIEKIVSSLRDFSQIDSSDSSEVIALLDVFENIAQLTEDKFAGKASLLIKCKTEGNIYGNKGDLSLSFMSLIMNAYEAILKKDMGDEGTISILIDEDEESLYIDIVDNGEGMTPEVRKNIFDPFFTTKEVGQGAGLGLTTAYNCIVNGLDGKMDIDSSIHVGTKVAITIPKRRNRNDS